VRRPQSWCDPAGASLAQERGSSRLVARLAWLLATAAAKREHASACADLVAQTLFVWVRLRLSCVRLRCISDGQFAQSAVGEKRRSTGDVTWRKATPARCQPSLQNRALCALERRRSLSRLTQSDESRGTSSHDPREGGAAVRLRPSSPAPGSARRLDQRGFPGS